MSKSFLGGESIHLFTHRSTYCVPGPMISVKYSSESARWMSVHIEMGRRNWVCKVPEV